MLILFVSLIFFILGIVLWQRGNRILSNGKKLEATIIKNVYSREIGEKGVYYPVIEFLSDKNEKTTKELSIGYYPAKKIGKRITIVYNPNRPHDVETYPEIYLVLAPRLLVAIGATGIIIAILDLMEIISLVSLWNVA